jgi:hypothetical protein
MVPWRYSPPRGYYSCSFNNVHWTSTGGGIPLAVCPVSCPRGNKADRLSPGSAPPVSRAKRAWSSRALWGLRSASWRPAVSHGLPLPPTGPGPRSTPCRPGRAGPRRWARRGPKPWGAVRCFLLPSRPPRQGDAPRGPWGPPSGWRPARVRPGPQASGPAPRGPRARGGPVWGPRPPRR